jgi:hypothetical protein
MERMVLMSIYQTITAAQEPSTKTILALIHAIELLAGNTKFVIERVREAVLPQQLV